MPNSVPCRHLLLQNKKLMDNQRLHFPTPILNIQNILIHTPNTDNLYPFISLPSVAKTAG
jgi:hypothetical protein